MLWSKEIALIEEKGLRRGRGEGETLVSSTERGGASVAKAWGLILLVHVVVLGVRGPSAVAVMGGRAIPPVPAVFPLR